MSPDKTPRVPRAEREGNPKTTPSAGGAGSPKETPSAVGHGRVPRLAAISGGTGEGWPLQFLTLNFDALAPLGPHAIGLTYWFDAAKEGDPYPVSVRFTGKRLDVKGKLDAKDTFQLIATMPRVLPGSGPVALTHRVVGVPPGRWRVTADAFALATGGAGRPRVPARRLPSGTTTGVSIYAPIARTRAPGVVLGAWPALVGLGVIAGLTEQSLLARERGLPSMLVLVIALVACVVGLVGAKVYYRLTHLEEKVGLVTVGMSIQGFVIAAIGTFLLGALLGGISIGQLLDVTVPSLLLGQAIGRLGCFFGGCCAGLPTSSRWGLWSSDRQYGTRRIPVQLMESALAATLAVVTALTILLAPPGIDGVVFIGGFALYTAGRQILFPLRGLPRKTTHGRQITLVVAAAAFLGAVAVAVLA